MRINIGRNLQRRFRSLVAIEGDLLLLGRSQSRVALFSVLTCLIVISSIAQAAIPVIDLKEAVDTSGQQSLKPGPHFKQSAVTASPAWRLFVFTP